jgi:hypothetical protein
LSSVQCGDPKAVAAMKSGVNAIVQLTDSGYIMLREFEASRRLPAEKFLKPSSSTAQTFHGSRVTVKMTSLPSEYKFAYFKGKDASLEFKDSKLQQPSDGQIRVVF